MKLKTDPGELEPYSAFSDPHRGIPSLRYRPGDIALATVFLLITVGLALWGYYAEPSDLRRPSFEPLDWVMESWRDITGERYVTWKRKADEEAAKRAAEYRFRHQGIRNRL